MRKFVCALFILLGALASISAQNSKSKVDTVAIEREIKAFYDAYSDDLKNSRRPAIVERYDPRGAHVMGNGVKGYMTRDDLKNKYLNFKAPKHFAWKELSVDVLTTDTVAVLGLFEWQTTGAVSTYSYTGLLAKRDGRWRIRVEDESRGVNPPVATPAN